MAAAAVHTELIEGVLPAYTGPSTGGITGAELVFRGVVRDEENGQPIVALFYEAYAEMAGKEFRNVCVEAASRYGLQVLHAWQRIGEVPVNEASLQIVMRSRHRESGLEAMIWLIKQIKLRVPVWKWGITADGRRFPSAHVEHGESASESGEGPQHEQIDETDPWIAKPK